MLTVSASSSHMSEWVQNRRTTPTETRTPVPTSAHSGGGQLASKRRPRTCRARARGSRPTTSVSPASGGSRTAVAGVSSTKSIGVDGNYKADQGRAGHTCSLPWVPAAEVPEPRCDVDSGDLAERVATISWYHSIDLGRGLVTPGNPPDQQMLAKGLCDLRGKKVLDIGAWDGYWSFLAERRGASSVVAMDHYAWSVDFAARLKYWEACERKGEVPDHRLDFSEFWRPDDLPGRAGFDLAREAIGSSVEPVVADFMTADPAQTGQFDVVLFLGVLYHVREPLTALEKVCGLTEGVAVIETEAIAILGMPRASLIEFHDGGGLRGDYTNWFVPTETALHAMCKAAGFKRVVTRIGPPPRTRQMKSAASRVQAGSQVEDRRSRDSSQLAVTRYRIAVHAYT